MRTLTSSTFLAIASLSFYAGCGSSDSGQAPALDEGTISPASANPDIAPAGRGVGTRENFSHSGSGGHGGGGNGIFYHGGPVMLGTVNLYYIWYGNWSGNSATTILTDLAQNLGGSPYENINSTYYDGSGTHVTGAIHYAGSTTDNYSQGTSLSDAQIQTVVSDSIASNRLPKDTNGIYFVLTSADVTASSGFCTQYCGWHDHGTIAGSDIKYSFVGNPDRCPSSCEEQTVGPNGNAGADGMASIIAHESEEAISDPDLNAWYDRRGYENADKCAWTFGTTYTVNGALANVKLGSRDYLIQRNWVNAGGGYCAMNYP
jgi:Phosphate-induced protein 1 conserved region